MTTQTEAMKLALEALEEAKIIGGQRKADSAITAIKEALAQPEQEPVAWTLLLVGAHNGLVGKAGDKFLGHPEYYERVDVYTSPPAQRTWVGLMRGVRVEGNTVVILTKDNDAARNLCGALIEEKNT